MLKYFVYIAEIKAHLDKAAHSDQQGSTCGCPHTNPHPYLPNPDPLTKSHSQRVKAKGVHLKWVSCYLLSFGALFGPSFWEEQGMVMFTLIGLQKPPLDIHSRRLTNSIRSPSLPLLAGHDSQPPFAGCSPPESCFLCAYLRPSFPLAHCLFLWPSNCSW